MTVELNGTFSFQEFASLELNEMHNRIWFFKLKYGSYMLIVTRNMLVMSYLYFTSIKHSSQI